MDREIKFRAWLPSEKKMVNVAGIHFAAGIVEIFGEDDSWDDATRDIDDIVLLEYTGLKDRKGQEIYDGDIVRVIWRNRNHGSIIREIEYGTYFGYYVEHIACWMIKDTNIPLSEMGTNFDVEVIGNIYENPELLK